VLSIDEMAGYHRDGFLVIEDFVTPDACLALRERANEIVAACEPGGRLSAAPRLFESAAGITCFFARHAFGPDGRLVQDKVLGVSKIGHAMHDLDPVFEAFTYTSQLAAVAHDVGLEDPLALQSTYLLEQPHTGGQVGCHQDAALLYTEPVTVTGFWFAIEDATMDNGCLWAQPGGHRGPLRGVYQRAEELGEGATKYVELDDTPLPDPPAGMVPIVARAGTMVVLHGLLPHWSDANRSSASRHAYSLHCISAAAHYPSWNWLQRPPTLPLRRLARVAAGARS
jgi:phytanoyl-CoA hydroxylase